MIADEADKDKLIRTSLKPIPPGEEEENFGGPGPSHYSPKPKALSFEHFKVFISKPNVNNIKSTLKS